MSVGTSPQWRKSTHSSASAACVEVTALPGGVGVRDSKNPDAGHLTVTPSQWAAFVGGVHAADFG